ncbi:hypothetical protein LIX60_30935 [Streptomyces sp. S07_1.15]|uniref:hypothetical protein n=1 Tax=Streptomyces sp. S07_1.15 TaxID=2873925 RepID=UPI001D14ED07|nr:hypothetical protein [Streptomyces sp. S07_1.15]MCC3655799.1 hypothetical protein [Streptomyces sp. S07_1.15]
MTTTEPADPPHIPEPDPSRDRDRLLLWLLAGGTALALAGYVLHQHPAFRETTAAVCGLGGLLLLAVQAARGR